MLALKHESKQKSVRLSIHYRTYKYFVEIFQTYPLARGPVLTTGLQQLSSRFKEADLQGWKPFSRSIDYLKDWKFDFEVDECERDYTRVRVCDEAGLKNVLAAIGGDEVTTNQSGSEEIDRGFLASTDDKRIIKQMLDESGKASPQDEQLPVIKITESRSTERCGKEAQVKQAVGEEMQLLRHSAGRDSNPRGSQQGGNRRMSDAVNKLKKLKMEKRHEVDLRRKSSPGKPLKEEEVDNCCICYSRREVTQPTSPITYRGSLTAGTYSASAVSRTGRMSPTCVRFARENFHGLSSKRQRGR